MTSAKKSKARAVPAHPTTPAPCLSQSLQNEDWFAETQKVKDEQMLAFYREYEKRITTALATYTARGLPGGKALPEEFLRQGSEHILSPPEELLELYTTLLRDNLDLSPKMRETLTDQAFGTSTLLHGDNLEQHFRQHQQHAIPQQKATCGCGVDHGDEGLAFPDDSYEDEPDEEEDDDDDDEDEDGEDEDEDEEDEDSMEDEEYDDDDEQEVIDGYAHHYEENNVKMMAHEEEKLRMESIRRVREEERRIKEEFRQKRNSEKQKLKEERELSLKLQRLRLEDEARRKKEALEREYRQKLEEEMRRKREAAEADQNARSFLFQCTMRSQIETVKQIIGATPEDSCSLTGVPRFATAAATRLVGWEFVTTVEGVGEVSEERGVQETLLHVAIRVGCVDLATFFIDKGAPLDALDKDGLSPLHTAAKHVSPFDICKLLIEKTAHHIDRTCIIAGRTALHYAAQNGYSDLVSLLLQHHARINILDLKGNTPESLAKSGLESALSEKSTKGNSKQASNAKVQRYRSTMQHIQKALAAWKEAQSRKDAQLEEQRRKDEALARVEAEKDNAARRKQEEKLEADQRRRLEEEKELERLKAMVSDPNGNNNNSNKKKKKKKGKTGSDAPTTTKDTLTPASTKADSSGTVSDTLSGHARTSTQSEDVIAHSSNAATSQTQMATKASSTTTTIPATNGTQSTPAPAPARIPKPKTSYRPSQLVVTRMTDMGFPLRESRKALIQTEGRVEDAIDLLTSGAQLADDSEDEAEQAAEKARAKAARAAAAAAATATAAKPAPAKAQEGYMNGHHGAAVRPVPPSSSTHSHNHVVHHASTQQHQQSHHPHQHHPQHPQHPPQHHQQNHPQQHPQQQQQQPNHRSNHAPVGAQQLSPRPAHHPVQILQRTHPMGPHAQPRSVPTQVLQRPPPQNAAPVIAHPHNPTMRKSFSGLSQPSVATSPISHPVTSIASFIAPRTSQPTPPMRPQYSYAPSTSAAHNTKPIVSPPMNATYVNHLPYKSPVSTPASLLDRSAPNRGSAGEVGTIGGLRKPSSVDLSEQGFGSGSGFSGFAAAAAASTWEVNVGGGNKGLAPSSLELPAPISTGFQSSTLGHNPWGSPGLSLSGPPLMQAVGDSTSISATFGSPFLTSLPTAHQQQQQQQQQHSIPQLSRPSAVGLSMDGLQGYGENDLDLGNAGGEMIKDVLAMTGAIDSEEFAKIEAEYSLLSPGASSNSGSGAASRTVGGGRSNSNSSASGQPMSALWGNGGAGGSGANGNHDGLPSPIGTMNGHALLSGRRGLETSFDSNGSNGLLSDSKGGISEYSQWNSGFALDQAMYPSSRQQQQGQGSSSSPFMSSFFGSQHLQSTTHPLVQPLSQFEYASFSGLGGGGGLNGTSSGASLASPTSPSFGSIGTIGGSRQQHSMAKSSDGSPKRN
ncbi:Tudor domain-containing protein 7 [Mortierella sp. GBA43]|nr:Tudor domain-containing protein 7 [Mortierella sp. GBA43]